MLILNANFCIHLSFLKSRAHPHSDFWLLCLTLLAIHLNINYSFSKVSHTEVSFFQKNQYVMTLYLYYKEQKRYLGVMDISNAFFKK